MGAAGVVLIRRTSGNGHMLPNKKIGILAQQGRCVLLSSANGSSGNKFLLNRRARNSTAVAAVELILDSTTSFVECGIDILRQNGTNSNVLYLHLHT